MTGEDQLVKAYRLSDARGKASILDYAQSMAEDWPDLLSLLANTSDLTSGKLEDVETPPVVSPPK